jgi:hypothetical protein
MDGMIKYLMKGEVRGSREHVFIEAEKYSAGMLVI